MRIYANFCTLYTIISNGNHENTVGFRGKYALPCRFGDGGGGGGCIIKCTVIFNAQRESPSRVKCKRGEPITLFLISSQLEILFPLFLAMWHGVCCVV